jgi:archaellum component FlaC
MNEQDVHAQLETLRSMIAEGFGKVESRFDGVDARFDGVDARFDGIDNRLDRMDSRFEGIDHRLDRMDARFDGIDNRLDGMDKRLGGVESEVRQAHVLIENLRDQVELVVEGFESMNEKLDRQYAQVDFRISALEAK